jgi:hypothetical protein
MKGAMLVGASCCYRRDFGSSGIAAAQKLMVGYSG